MRCRAHNEGGRIAKEEAHFKLALHRSDGAARALLSQAAGHRRGGGISAESFE
jgi:hypothetical protein